MVQRLPNELCDTIIGIVGEDTAHRWKDLQNASLVCRAWCIFSQPRLFCPCPVFAFSNSSFAEMRDRENEGPWLAWLAKAPEVAQLTRKITIRQWPTSLSPATGLAMIRRLAETFLSVETVRIDLVSEGISWPYVDHIMLSFPLLKNVDIVLDRGSRWGPSLSVPSTTMPIGTDMHDSLQSSGPKTAADVKVTIEMYKSWDFVLPVLRPDPSRASTSCLNNLHTLVLDRAHVSHRPTSQWDRLCRTLETLEGLKSLKIDDVLVSSSDQIMVQAVLEQTALRNTTLEHVEIVTMCQLTPCCGTMLKYLLSRATLPSLKRLTLVFTNLPTMKRSNDSGSTVQYFAPFGPVAYRRKSKFTRDVIQREVLSSLAEVEIWFQANRTVVMFDSPEFLQLFGDSADLSIGANGHVLEFGAEDT